jgi:hypothetical protein
MTDATAGWKSDPTGRHDHRYWDGSAWTEHVSDAGVAATDPYDGAPEPAAPPVPTPSATEPALEAPAAVVDSPAPTEPTSTSWMTKESTEEGTEWAADPEPVAPSSTFAGPAAADAPPTEAPVVSSWASPTVVNQPTEPVTPTPAPIPAPASDEPTTEFRMTEGETTFGADTAFGTGANEAPTAVEGATSVEPPSAGDEPTLGQPTFSPLDPTATWPVAPSSAEAPAAPTFTPPPTAESPGDGSDGARRRLLIGVGVVALVAILAGVFLLGGDDDDGGGDLQTRIANQIREGGQSGLDQEEAECLAGELIDEVGADKLERVDFTAEAPPEDIADEINDAFVAAIPTCDIELGGSADERDEGDTGSPDDTEPGDGSADSTLSPGQLDEFRDLLATQYRDNLGLSEEKSDCLADTMADAIESGELDENQSFDAFFQYLETCDISVSELGGPQSSGG